MVEVRLISNKAVVYWLENMKKSVVQFHSKIFHTPLIFVCSFNLIYAY